MSKEDRLTRVLDFYLERETEYRKARGVKKDRLWVPLVEAAFRVCNVLAEQRNEVTLSDRVEWLSCDLIRKFGGSRPEKSQELALTLSEVSEAIESLEKS